MKFPKTIYIVRDENDSACLLADTKAPNFAQVGDEIPVAIYTLVEERVLVCKPELLPVSPPKRKPARKRGGR